MKEKNPDYVPSIRAHKKRVATRCRVCGGQLIESSEIKKEMHERCNKDNTNMYMM